jgi:hypothetical protein
MNWKHIVKLNALVIIMILPAGCERDEFSWGTKIGNITYSGNVVFLGPEELALLNEVTADRLVFSEVRGEIEKIAEKSILVMGVSEKTPYGSLRKVISVQLNKTELVLTTSDSNLDDAIKEGTITLKRSLTEKDFKLKAKTDGVLVKGPNKSFDGLAITLINFEIFTDGTKTARLNGAMGISPEIGITIKLEFNKISEINLVTTLNKIDEVTVSSNGSFNGQQEIIAAEFIHSPIIIDSLVFVPEVIMSCGFNGSVSSEVSSGVRQDRVITSKMNYSNSRWFDDPLTHTENYDFSKPQVTDNSDLEILSGAEIRILLFGVPIQSLKATGFYSLEADKTGSPLWKLFIGNEGHNTVIADILGLREDYTSDMAVNASEIGNADSK